MVGREAGGAIFVHRDRKAAAGLARADAREADALRLEQLRDQRVFRMRRGQDHAIGLQRGDGAEQFARDMVAVRVDQLDH